PARRPYQAAGGACPLRAGVHAVRERHHAGREGRSRQGARVNAAATRAVALLGALALWAAVAHGNAWLGVVNPVLLPTQGEVGRVGLELAWSGELTRHFLTSLGRVAQGFGLAALAALGLGLLVAMCVPLRLLAEPVIEFVRPIDRKSTRLNSS